MNALERYQALVDAEAQQLVAAWRVVEAMRARGYGLTLREREDGLSWEAAFTLRERPEQGAGHYAATAWDAILGAATAAMEGEGR